MDNSLDINPDVQGVGDLERTCGALSLLIGVDQGVMPLLTGETLQQMIGAPPSAQGYVATAQTLVLISTAVVYGGIRRLFAPRIQSTPAQVEIPEVKQLVEVSEIKPDPTRTYGAEQRSRGLYENQLRTVEDRSKRFETQRRVAPTGDRLYEDQLNVAKDVPSGNYKSN